MSPKGDARVRSNECRTNIFFSMRENRNLTETLPEKLPATMSLRPRRYVAREKGSFIAHVSHANNRLPRFSSAITFRR